VPSDLNPIVKKERRVKEGLGPTITHEELISSKEDNIIN
jgi:hypothetical protein